ncbi:hypothetical protein MIMGU_mgv1a0233482mg, partial [Erythranthe guttata]
MGITGKSKSEW